MQDLPGSYAYMRASAEEQVMHCPKCDGRMEHCIMVETGEAPRSGWYCEVCDDLVVEDESHAEAPI